jgi:autophagy-related protein 5
MASRDATSRVREGVWNGSVPLEIRLHKGDCRTYDESDPYLVSIFSNPNNEATALMY